MVKATHICLLLSIAGAAIVEAQDVLTVGTATAPPGGTAQVPVYVRDTAATPLGTDAGTGNRIQGIGFKVTWSSAAVSSVTFSRAGVTAALTPLYEQSIPSTNAHGNVVSFHELDDPIAFATGAALPGDRIGTLAVTFTEAAAGGTVVTLTIDAATATLSNQAGTVGETTANGHLSLVSGSAVVEKAATTTTVATSGSPSLVGENVTFTATVSSGTAGTISGDVTFRDGSTTLGTTALSGGTATWSTTALSEGSHSITATYNGDAKYAASTSAPITQVVTSPFGAPSNVIATATSASQVSVTWSPVSGAVYYEVFRSSNNSAFAPAGIGSAGYTDGNVTGGTTYLYRVRAVDGSSTRSDFSGIDAATTIVFTDDPIAAGTTTVKAVHLAQLRTAVDAFRAAAGLGPYAFTDAGTAGETVRALHVEQLRAALDAARLQLAFGTLAYTDDSLTAGATAVKGVHFQELRDAVK